MGAITITQKGDFHNTERWLAKLKSAQMFAVGAKYGSIGQNALSNATPVDSGLAASSWSYSIVQRTGYFSIRWHNSDVENGFHVAVMIQYGHGTGTGGYVQGRDYINPAMRPIFDQIVADVMREVSRI
jgi:hypothetical protein